ncbi:MAG: glycoside hydrolase family 140 protein [Firmicutes bacterium]|nr:glycoside hydrolase family 140 protein [Bacillota bacterium]
MLLKTHGNYLCREDGSPFFYLADTAWELFHRLGREEIDLYLGERARQGFTVIQAAALSEFDGLTVPNACGRLPLKAVDGRFSPLDPDTDGDGNYWDHVDYAIRKAAGNGLFIGLLPTWGDKWNRKWGAGPEIFTPENAKAYGVWFARRFGGYDNIIWILGGDRPVETDAQAAVIDGMARGLREGEAKRHLMTFHPMGERSSAEFLAGKDYMDFHMIQSGHGVGRGYESWKMLRETYETDPRPFLNGEPRYEDHPACFNFSYNFLWDAADARMNLYWDVFEGACGHTYGNHCIWSFNREMTDYYPFRWKDALTHEGARTMRYAKELRLSRGYFSLRPAPELAEDDGGVTAHVACARGDGYAYVYSPLGAPINVRLGELGARTVKLSWYNPRNGLSQVTMIAPGGVVGKMVPPTCGKGNDWVLIMDKLD